MFGRVLTGVVAGILCGYFAVFSMGLCTAARETRRDCRCAPRQRQRSFHSFSESGRLRSIWLPAISYPEGEGEW